MSKCKRCNKLHMLRNDYCEGCQPYIRIAELEVEVAQLKADRDNWQEIATHWKENENLLHDMALETLREADNEEAKSRQPPLA